MSVYPVTYIRILYRSLVYLSVPCICVRFTFTVQRVSGSDIWKVPFYLDGALFFACRAQNYIFCLLIVRYMLSDKIKGKSTLNARTFIHVRDKVHVQAVYASIDGKQAQMKPFIGEIFTY